MEIVSAVNTDEKAKEEIAALMAACRAFGENPSLETDFALNVYPDMKSVFRAYEGGRLVGAASVFAPTGAEAELCALVSPKDRRKGVFTALRNAVEDELRRRCFKELLFLVDSSSAAGKAIAEGLGGSFDRSEYVLERRCEGGLSEAAVFVPELRIREVGIESLAELVGLNSGEFGDSPEETENFLKMSLAAPGRKTYAGYEGPSMIVSCALEAKAGGYGLYGLVVAPSKRGRGVGAAFLRSLFSLACRAGETVSLEVDSGNPAARRLYAKVGFLEKSRDDYYRLSLSRRTGSA